MHGDAAVLFKLAFFVFLIGVVLMVIGYRMNSKLEEHEFNNRTSGGVVEFKDYQASKSHQFKKNIARLIMSFAVLPLFFGGCTAAVALVNG